LFGRHNFKVIAFANSIGAEHPLVGTVKGIHTENPSKVHI
jgi:hypothetical protein